MKLRNYFMKNSYLLRNFNPSSVICKEFSINPCIFNCFGTKCILEIGTLSSMVYPGIEINSIRSSNGLGIDFTEFAVAMNKTWDKSNATFK